MAARGWPTGFNGEELEALLAQAAQLASSVPAPMQAAAFSAAFSSLAATRPAGSDASPSGRRPSRKRAHGRALAPRQQGVLEPSAREREIATLMTNIDRTQFQVDVQLKTLDRSLYVLKIAKDAGVDGLLPSEIARILREKFRVATADSAVRMALGSARAQVDRRHTGLGFRYYLMDEGEKYLARVLSAKPQPPE